MSLRPLVTLPSLLILAACASPAAPPATSPAIEGHCDADAANTYIGRAADAATVEAARKSAGAERVRTLKPGQMVTMEYLAGRLNLHLDASGRIERIGCG
ncbi:MAG: starvation-inducible protein [Lysobacteraceae bacterium]|nr:MAG: starvation-inducible protein [Xanthomonadaceae bacterium]